MRVKVGPKARAVKLFTYKRASPRVEHGADGFEMGGLFRALGSHAWYETQTGLGIPS